MMQKESRNETCGLCLCREQRLADAADTDAQSMEDLD